MSSAGITIEVKSNADQVARAMRNLGERQMPFVIAASLTALAKEGQGDVRGGLSEHFTVRNKRVEAGIRSIPAEKRDWPNIFAVVGSKDEFMVQHETGDTKRPRSGRHLAIPNVAEHGRAGVITRTSSGAIPAHLKPRRVLGRRRAFLQRVGKYGRLAILQRTTKKRYPIRVLYGFRNSARIEKVEWFSPRVQRVVARRYPAIFEGVMQKAFGEEARRVVDRWGR